MLDKLYIKNFALIKEMDISFSKGFNVLVGETGAGKSIIISALLFAMGNKADKTFIRSNENFTKVVISFSNIPKFIKQTFYDYEIDEELVISRIYYSDGKNDCKVNGSPISLAELKNLTSYLIDCCLQHENISVLKTKNQIKFLDDFIGKEIFDLKNDLKTQITLIKDIDEQLARFGGDENNRNRLIDLLSYQIKEIEDISPKENEDNELIDKISKLNNSEKIKEASFEIINNIDGNLGCLTLLKNSIHNLEFLNRYDSKYSNFYDRTNNCIYELEDILEEIKNDSSSLFYDENELERLDKRLDLIKNLKKKYGNTIDDIYVFLNNAKNELDNLLNAEEKINDLNSKRNTLISKIYNICIHMTNIRREQAKIFENKIITELNELSMKNALFSIDFNEIPSISEFTYNENGFDKIEFLFSANKGQELKSLTKTISGGELSRFMLAFKNIFVSKDNVDTLILDEIDAGISGETGVKVSQKIANISKNIQVICISHMQQVISMADNYLFVEKQIIDDKTESKIKTLNYNEQINYIAKITSGDNITQNAINNAKELKEICNNYKNKI